MSTTVGMGFEKAKKKPDREPNEIALKELQEKHTQLKSELEAVKTENSQFKNELEVAKAENSQLKSELEAAKANIKT